jgi:hypothetical protein
MACFFCSLFKNAKISFLFIFFSNHLFSQIGFPVQHNVEIENIAYCLDYNHFASSDKDGLINIHDGNTRNQIESLIGFPSYTLFKKITYKADTLITMCVDFVSNSSKKQLVVQKFDVKNNYKKVAWHQFPFNDSTDIANMRIFIKKGFLFYCDIKKKRIAIQFVYNINKNLFIENELAKKYGPLIEIKSDTISNLKTGRIEELDAVYKIFKNTFQVVSANGNEIFSFVPLNISPQEVFYFNSESDILTLSDKAITHFSMFDVSVKLNFSIINRKISIAGNSNPNKASHLCFYSKDKGQIYIYEFNTGILMLAFDFSEEIDTCLLNNDSNELLIFIKKSRIVLCKIIDNKLTILNQVNFLREKNETYLVSDTVKIRNRIYSGDLVNTEIYIDDKKYSIYDSITTKDFQKNNIITIPLYQFTPLKSQLSLLTYMFKYGTLCSGKGFTFFKDKNLGFEMWITMNFEKLAITKINIKLGKCFPHVCTLAGADFYNDIVLCKAEFQGIMVSYDSNNDISVHYNNESNNEIYFDSSNNFKIRKKREDLKFETRLKIIYTNLFIQNDSILYASSNNGIISKYNFKRGNPVFHLILNNGDFLLFNDEGYFMGSKEFSKYITYYKNGKRYSMDQFESFFNKPSHVLKTIENQNLELQQMYLRVEKKRNSIVSFDSLFYSSTKVYFKNTLFLIKNYKNENKVCLNYVVECGGNFEGRINLYVNNCPVFSTSGKPCVFNTVYKDSCFIELNSGNNIFQLFAIDKMGRRSETAEFFLNRTVNKPNKVFLLGIGFDEYKDPGYKLSYPSKDIMDLNRLLKSNFKSYSSKFFVNTPMNRTDLRLIKDSLKMLDPDDVVIMYFSGHGILDKYLNYFLASSFTDFENPTTENSFQIDELIGLLDSIPPRKKVFFIDACHSGEVDKEEVKQLAQTNINNSEVKFRAAGAGIQKKNLGLKTTSELMGELFTDLRRGTGATVISSAGGVELAMESDKWQNGLFTYCLLHGLKDKAADANSDGQIMLSELQQYLRTEVTRLSNGAQQPTSRIENLSMDFRIW